MKSPIVAALIAPHQPVVLCNITSGTDAVSNLLKGNGDPTPIRLEHTSIRVGGAVALTIEGASSDKTGRYPQNRFNTANGTFIHGPFLVVGMETPSGGYGTLSRAHLAALNYEFGHIDLKSLEALPLEDDEDEQSDPFASQQEYTEPDRLFFSNLVWEHICDSDYYTGRMFSAGTTRPILSDCVYAVHKAGDSVCLDTESEFLVCSCENDVELATEIVAALNARALKTAPEMAQLCRDSEKALAQVLETPQDCCEVDRSFQRHTLRTLRELNQRAPHPIIP